MGFERGPGRHSNGRSAARVTGREPGDCGLERQHRGPTTAALGVTAARDDLVRLDRARVDAAPQRRSSQRPSAPATRRRRARNVRLPALKPRVGGAERARRARGRGTPRPAPRPSSPCAGPSSTATGAGSAQPVRRANAKLRVVAEAGLAVAIPDARPCGRPDTRRLRARLHRAGARARQHRPEIAAAVLP